MWWSWSSPAIAIRKWCKTTSRNWRVTSSRDSRWRSRRSNPGLGVEVRFMDASIGFVHLPMDLVPDRSWIRPLARNGLFRHGEEWENLSQRRAGSSAARSRLRGVTELHPLINPTEILMRRWVRRACFRPRNPALHEPPPVAGSLPNCLWETVSRGRTSPAGPPPLSRLAADRGRPGQRPGRNRNPGLEMRSRLDHAPSIIRGRRRPGRTKGRLRGSPDARALRDSWGPHRVVVPGPPMLLHASARELVVLRVALVLLGVIDQLHEDYRPCAPRSDAAKPGSGLSFNASGNFSSRSPISALRIFWARS